MTSDCGILKKECRPAARSGFTLVELCLVLALLAMVGGVAAVSLASWRATRFEEHVDRCESLLRMLRADAANRARRIELGFDDAGAFVITWEPDPLERPGEFVPYTAALWKRYVPDQGVMVTRCELTGQGIWRSALLADAAEGDLAIEAIRFERDGTSDSARIELAPVDEGDPRRAVIQWNGRTALAETTLLDVEKLDAFYEELAENERTPYDRE